MAGKGNFAASVTGGSKQIKAVVHEAANTSRLDYSHFVSLPLAVYPELVNNLIKFQNSILETSDASSSYQFTSKESKASSVGSKNSKLSDMRIDSSLFIKPKTFHLTVLMLKLWNEDRVEAAVKVLQSVSAKVVDALESRPISVRLKGLESMSGSFAKTRVLYVPVEEIDGNDRLLRACQVIIDAFVEARLVLKKDAQRKLKLHATVMNVLPRERRAKTSSDYFDASKIREQYGTMEWGNFVIYEAHLSKRFEFDESGYYHCCASIPFPRNMQKNRLICCLPF